MSPRPLHAVPARTGTTLRSTLLCSLCASLLVACPTRHLYPDGSDLTGQLEREVIALQQTVRALEYQVQTCGSNAEADTMYQELHQLLGGGEEVTIDREGNITLLGLPADFLFSRGTDLRDEAAMTLDLLATALKVHSEHTVVLEGHTDDLAPSGDLRRLYGDNWILSFARAEAVMMALTQRFGVEGHRFTIQARASYDPVATNDTVAGQRKNRRVVARIIPPSRPVIPE